ncbi:MAG: 4-hydroxy-tetrahydrodipicolinate synthase [Eubacteriales bacterium]|nr:4-hydroxy-tetrahydrodipicolinate synthase [Eubacteriales bacterium]
MLRLQGSIVALVTPFNRDGSVDYARTGELVDWHIAHKTDGIVVLGTTGESSTMTGEEADKVCKLVVERAAGRIPVIAGSGSNCTATMLQKSLRYQNLGVDGLLVIAPYYNKANEEGMYRHFATVADAVNLPCILYNVPGRTGCSISEKVVLRLYKHENIAAIKEASGNLSYASQIARYLSDDFRMFSGNDDIIVPMMALGSSGVISVFANIFPEVSHNIVADFLNGDIESSRAAQLKYLEVINSLFIEVNPIPVKAAMNRMGLRAGSLRLPLYEMGEGAKARLESALREVGAL